MKRTLSLTLFIFISFFISAQSDVFESDICEDWLYDSNAGMCSDGLWSFPINVTGVGELGEDNFGIVEVWIHLLTNVDFSAEVKLVAPNGDEFILAGESLGSFPAQVDETIDVAFRGCCTLDQHDHPSAQEGDVYQPYEDFTILNEGVVNGNGEWFIQVCGNEYFYGFLCASLTFGPLHPEAFIFTAGSSCFTSNNGVISVLGVEGDGCDGDDEFFFSLNGGDITSETTYDGLVAGETYILGMYEELPGGSCNPDENLIEEYIIEIYSEDLTFPEIIDCPEGAELYLDDDCKISYDVIAPDFIDNCGILSAQVYITPPNGNQSDPVDFEPGESFLLALSTDGDYTYLWEVIDDNNNVMTCETEFEITDNQAPQWIIQHAEVYGECEIDDLNELLDVGLNMLQASDNCHDPEFDEVDFSDDSGCGESMFYTFTFEVLDSEENVNPETGTVTIYLEDTTAPDLIGIPADITINCLDDYPNLPNVTAQDECEGNLTDAISMSSETTVVTCETGEMAESIIYNWTVIDGCGNQAEESWEISIDMASSSNDISLLEEEVVFPKVTSHMITLNLGNITNCKIFIQDAGGKLITSFDTKQQKEFQSSIDVESYESGIYFISIITAEGVHTEQFIKI